MSKTEDYDALVTELHAEFGELDNATIDSRKLEQNIIRVTQGMSQEPESKEWPISTKWSLKSFFIPSACITSLALLSLVFLNVGLVTDPAVPVVVTVSEEADLTFQELWLVEDELLFSDEL